MQGKYDDIIHLPRPASRRAPMSRHDRAAQFSPFAALTGYEAVIAETGRLTEDCTELDESRKAELNAKLVRLLEMRDSTPEVAILYFENDALKSGGAYRSVTARVKKIDLYTGQVLLTDGTAIDLEQIRDIEME